MENHQDAIILGLDIGTSAVKALLVDRQQGVLASTSLPLEISRPAHGWSEQDPSDWVTATFEAFSNLQRDAPEAFVRVRAIGMSGQMHGAVVVDARGTPLRPAILWNDARAEAECDELLAAFPELPDVAGVLPMAGLTAPKLVWLRKHEPEVFKAIHKVLLPKDFVRFVLTGDYCTDMCDAAGSLWLDEAQRRWSERSVSTTGLSLAQMPRVIEGTEISGTVAPDLCSQFGWAPGVIVAGGSGDSAAGAVGLGAVDDGDAFISLGTSCQLFVTTAAYRPRPETLVHAFAHCLPGRWLQQAAMLNGASCLAWIASVLGRSGDIDALLQEVAAAGADDGASDVLFLPYLVGERTPHNNAHARGVFFGLGATTSALDLTRAVLTGVAYSIREAREVLAAAGTPIDAVGIVGGGSRSALWLQIISDVTGMALSRLEGTELGPAFGAARLARIALTGETVQTVCSKPAIADRFVPDARRSANYAEGFGRYRRLYAALKPEFKRSPLLKSM
jgi:xylulokinase